MKLNLLISSYHPTSPSPTPPVLQSVWIYRHGVYCISNDNGLDILHYRNDVTVVDYTVQRNDDEPIEDLKSPKRVDLERSLNTAGKTLYSKSPVTPPEEVILF